jgi:serine/threonine-protein kinase
MLERIGKYRILGRIATGGMGSVYKAHDPMLEREVALKVISAGADVGDELRARFFLEGQACARLSHPNIVSVYDLGEADGHLFIVMEMLEGEELRRIIARRAPLHLRDRLSLIGQLCDGLDYAHGKGIVHRDVKPANLIVLPSGQLKILDFGIARIEAAKTALTRTGLLIGTLQYMAPERLRGHGDHRADVFSAGAVLYELLTYRPPFRGEDPLEILEEVRSVDPPAPSTIDSSLPAEIDTIVARALDKDATRRFDTLRAMRAALQPVCAKADELAERVAADVRADVDAVARLAQTVALRIGREDPSVGAVTVDAQMSLAALEAVRADALARREQLQRLLSHADALAPDFARALHAVEREELDAAIRQLEHVVAAMPEHARAAAALEDVRKRRDERQRRDEASQAQAAARPDLDPDATVIAAVETLTGPRSTMTPVDEIVAPAAERPPAPSAPPASLPSRSTTRGSHRHAGKVVAAAAALSMVAAGVWWMTSEPRTAQITVAGPAPVAVTPANPVPVVSTPPAASPVAAAPVAAHEPAGATEPSVAAARPTDVAAAPLAEPAMPTSVASTPPEPPASTRSHPEAKAGSAAADPQSEIRTSLGQYARAIETKDLRLLRRVRPGLTDDETRRWARSFEITRSRKVALQFYEISVDADQARAIGRRDDVVVMHDGRRLQTRTRFVCTLKRGDRGWVIEEFKDARESRTD